jgi:hypothetical protein
MTQDMNLKELEKKAWTSYFDDGILDITAGLFILLFGVGMTTRFTYLTAFSWMVIFLFAAAKKSITLPRVGIVKFNPQREQRMKRETSFYLVFFTITAVIGLVFFLLMTVGIPQSVKSFVGNLALIAYELIIAVGLCFVAYWKQIRRFYAYGALVFLLTMTVTFFTIPPAEHMFFSAAYQFIISGVVILIVGLVVLAQFLRKYPQKEGREYAPQ